MPYAPVVLSSYWLRWNLLQGWCRRTCLSCLICRTLPLPWTQSTLAILHPRGKVYS